MVFKRIQAARMASWKSHSSSAAVFLEKFLSGYYPEWMAFSKIPMVSKPLKDKACRGFEMIKIKSDLKNIESRKYLRTCHSACRVCRVAAIVAFRVPEPFLSPWCVELLHLKSIKKERNLSRRILKKVLVHGSVDRRLLHTGVAKRWKDKKPNSLGLN